MRMTKRAHNPPAGFAKPEHWTNDPLPKPEQPVEKEGLSPTRYGDWVKDGVAVDF